MGEFDPRDVAKTLMTAALVAALYACAYIQTRHPRIARLASHLFFAALVLLLAYLAVILYKNRHIVFGE